MSPCVVLELYATEIQMYSELKDSKKMKVCKIPGLRDDSSWLDLTRT